MGVSFPLGSIRNIDHYREVSTLKILAVVEALKALLTGIAFVIALVSWLKERDG